jgi:hypothetical protein
VVVKVNNGQLQFAFMLALLSGSGFVSYWIGYGHGVETGFRRGRR